jgi:hypothetical protein
VKFPTITVGDDEEDDSIQEQQIAEILYGMIHARYLLSAQGLIAMVSYLNYLKSIWFTYQHSFLILHYAYE